MPRLTKIYTRKGDDGTTALGTRTRVPKHSLRVDAYGTVDELNALIGLALAQGLDELIAEALPMIQNDLLHLGAELAFPPGEKEFEVPKLEQKHVQALEDKIDELNAQLPPLENFVLPGGDPGAATLQVARTVCRRAERRLAALAAEEPLGPDGLSYINRLSDLLFVMARFENDQKGVEQPLWDSWA